MMTGPDKTTAEQEERHAKSAKTVAMDDATTTRGAHAAHDAQNDDIPLLLPRDQLAFVHELICTPLQDGDTWYVVPYGWYCQWEKHCSREMASGANDAHDAPMSAPGPLDVAMLLGNDNLLLLDLVENQDYKLVPARAWLAFVRWYGCVSTSVPRKVLTDGDLIPETAVEMYPPTFMVYAISDTPSSFPPRELSVSRATPIGAFKQAVLATLGWSAGKPCRFYRVAKPKTRSMSNTAHVSWCDISDDVELLSLEDDNMTMLESSLTRGNLLVDADIDGDAHAPWPRTYTRGATGLYNLGHTCFMNSALQCLSNTEPLTTYFLENKHEKELNRNNALGLQGDLAMSYGRLVHQLWRGQAGRVTPRDFRYHIGRFHAEFQAYQRQDSQELLAFLLDGMHEDLNRIAIKPYMELPDLDDTPDADVAKMQWDYHQSRNDSVIVDLFHGQFKSSLTCQDCGKSSMAFDPFMYLSLPIPAQEQRTIALVYASYGSPCQAQQHIDLVLDKTASILDFKKALAERVGVSDPGTLWVTQLAQNKLIQVFNEADMVALVSAWMTIHVYELPVSQGTATMARDEWLVFPLYVMQVPDGTTEQPHVQQRIDPRLKRHVGPPLLVAVATSQCQSQEAILASAAEQWQRYAGGEDVRTVPYQVMVLESVDDGKKALVCEGKAAWHRVLTVFDPIKKGDDQQMLRHGQGLVIQVPETAVKQHFAKIESVWPDKEPPVVARPPRHWDATLSECLAGFSAAETLDDDWFCRGCQKHTRGATKQMGLWRVPEILIVHLKRFSQTLGLLHEKLDDAIDFPLNGLDMAPFVLDPQQQAQPLIYDLLAINNHVGKGVLDGHYGSVARNFEDDQWYYLEDDQVTPMQASDVKTNSAYMLFYKRRINV
ncbi:hypothetical protein BC940DRAFT_287994 [Gongronella butleri]|nr:hypothetical protein BC940DRAFT_287994 [Gongronella butleri]